MIQNSRIEKLLINQPDISFAAVEGDGYHYQITVVSPSFQKLSKVKRHQKIYALLNEWISEGSLHAVSMSTFTPEEWKRHDG